MPTAAEHKAGQLLIDFIRREIHPKHKDHFKHEERSSKVLGYLLAPFNPSYDRFNTTRYPNIYWAAGEPVKQQVKDMEWHHTKTRAHEAVHMWDRKRLWWFFNLIYGAPQILAPLWFIPLVLFGGLWGAAALGAMFLGLGVGYVWARQPAWFFSWAAVGVVGGLTLAVWQVGWHAAWFAGAALFLSPALNFLGAAYGRAWAEFRGYTMSMACNYWKYGNIHPDTKKWVVKHFVGGNYYWMLPWRSYVEKRLDRVATDLASGIILKDPIFKKVYNIMYISGLVHDPYPSGVTQ